MPKEPMQDLSLDLRTLRAEYATGLDPVDVVDLVYARIAHADDAGIFISLVPQEKARADARALGPFDPQRSLWGIPFAVKDNIDSAGLPTTAACPAFAYHPEQNSFVVEQLVAAGALLIGKTNLDQFATGLVGVRTPYPAPRNPFSSDIIPGGSSSGSAVAVARGLVSFALGTDTAGSGRVPAALNNIVGLKPSVGALSVRGLVPACRTLDCVSVFTMSVDDAWSIFETMAAVDAEDPFQRPIVRNGLSPVAPAPRVGVPSDRGLEFFGDGAAQNAWQQAIALLGDIGARTIEIEMAPFLEAARLLYDGPWIAERHVALRDFIADNEDAVLPVTRSIIAGAQRFSASDVFKSLYRLKQIAHDTRDIWAKIDLLCVPSIPCIPTLEDVASDPLGHNARLGRWTNFVNLLDLCALAVPGPFRRDHLPAGVTFIAPRGMDDRLASFGRVFHSKADVALGAGVHRLAACNTPVPSPEHMIEIVVVGAHLSDMPLNCELTNLGGRFARAVETADCYRLYALAGGPPMRPGLMRCAKGAGHKIATEVWTLPPEGFAQFVSSIPSPLGIGTIILADDTRPKGFLVEPEGLVGAQDISHFGGWRQFVASIR